MSRFWLAVLIPLTLILGAAAAHALSPVPRTAPVEFTFLGLSPDKKLNRYEIKILTDKPISQVDFETGALITQAIRRLAGARTILIVSHRLSAVRFADRILVLDGGRVVHTGRHADLLAAHGYYAGTYRLQEVEEGGDAA